MRSDIVAQAVKAAGGPTKLGDALGIKMTSLYSWRRIPAERVLAVERVTGIPRTELRPDLYGPAEAAA